MSFNKCYISLLLTKRVFENSFPNLPGCNGFFAETIFFVHSVVPDGADVRGVYLHVGAHAPVELEGRAQDPLVGVILNWLIT